jgi:fructose-1-phosphate kinase PfkB-like protein
LVIAEAIHQRHSHIIYGEYYVPPEALEGFFERYRQYVPQAKWVIGAGSLPQGVPMNFYRRIIQIAAEYDVPVLIDCPGQPALEAMSVPPKILKMNWDEFQRTFQVKAPTLEDLIQQAAKIYKLHSIPNFVITCGEHGILAFTEQGVYLVSAPRQKAINAAGAGDAVSAVLGWRLSLGEDWMSALKWAAATGAAVVLTEGTADCDPHDVERIYPQTTIQQLTISLERINS